VSAHAERRNTEVKHARDDIDEWITMEPIGEVQAAGHNKAECEHEEQPTVYL
jgi:hypothetical protein